MRSVFSSKARGGAILVALVVAASSALVEAQGPIGNDAFSFQIYYVNPGFYPIVQTYLRTFDQNMEPISSLNLMNVGIQVDGKNYDPAKSFDMQTRRGMYGIDTLQNRDEAFRTVFVWDCSGSMAGKPFEDAKSAIVKYIQIKRPADQVAVIAIRDTTNGYQLVSSFEKDPTLLLQRIEDVKCDGQKTRLYDSVLAALELCASTSQGAINNTTVEIAILNCIVVVSDGHDEGSALSKDVLVTKLGSLKPPVPIYGLAYSNTPERQYFTNIEALSKATFGQYWTVGESQNFATALQKIHQINRSDYVVTFRASAPVDGNDHNFAIGIQWPSNSGRFIFRQGQFTAMESPAMLVGGKAKETYERLMQAYPVPSQVSVAAPVPPGQPAPNAPAVQAAPNTPPDAKPVDAGPKTESNAPAPSKAMDTKDVLLIAAIGAAIIFLIIAVVIWVRSNAVARQDSPSSSRPSSRPPTSNP